MAVLLNASQAFVVDSPSPAHTAAIGAAVAAAVRPPAIIALCGDLGAGKTEFVKGFVSGSSVESAVSSPTFSILNTYDGAERPIYHFDLYRIEGKAELAELGFDEYVFGEGICLIEWAERAEGWLPPETIHMRFEHIDDTTRRVSRL
jgi:tRNA threonylcarbamoyladenosine biosynthesis protein TsaE